MDEVLVMRLHMPVFVICGLSCLRIGDSMRAKRSRGVHAIAVVSASP
jgi:hypothetical protein